MNQRQVVATRDDFWTAVDDINACIRSLKQMAPQRQIREAQDLAEPQYVAGEAVSLTIESLDHARSALMLSGRIAGLFTPVGFQGVKIGLATVQDDGVRMRTVGNGASLWYATEYLDSIWPAWRAELGAAGILRIEDEPASSASPAKAIDSLDAMLLTAYAVAKCGRAWVPEKDQDVLVKNPDGGEWVGRFDDVRVGDGEVLFTVIDQDDIAFDMDIEHIAPLDE